jgi:hypothetical protein
MQCKQDERSQHRFGASCACANALRPSWPLHRMPSKQQSWLPGTKAQGNLYQVAPHSLCIMSGIQNDAQIFMHYTCACQDHLRRCWLTLWKP